VLDPVGAGDEPTGPTLRTGPSRDPIRAGSGVARGHRSGHPRRLGRCCRFGPPGGIGPHALGLDDRRARPQWAAEPHARPRRSRPTRPAPQSSTHPVLPCRRRRRVRPTSGTIGPTADGCNASRGIRADSWAPV